jgi:hypothetical protein
MAAVVDLAVHNDYADLLDELKNRVNAAPPRHCGPFTQLFELYLLPCPRTFGECEELL